MAINPLIPLAGKGLDVGRTFNNALLNVKGIQNIQQASKQNPLRNQLLQAQVSQAQSQVPTGQQTFDEKQARILNSAGNFAKANRGLVSTNPQLAMENLGKRFAELEAAGLDSSHTRRGLELIQQSPEAYDSELQRISDAQDQMLVAANPQAQAANKFFAPIVNPDGSMSLPGIDPNTNQPFNVPIPGAVGETPVQKTQRMVDEAVGKAAAVAGVELETKPEITRRTTEAEKRAKAKEEREQGFIDQGIVAADATPVIRRAISLLDKIDTGGLNAVLLRAKQLFGVEGADEGELSSNLGKAVISQLRETFGAAFTVGEGDKLDSIEAGFGKNAKTNRRLLGNTLKILERKAKRGRSSADSRGDDFSIQAIDDALIFDLGEAKGTAEPAAHPSGQGAGSIQSLVDKYAD